MYKNNKPNGFQIHVPFVKIAYCNLKEPKSFDNQKFNYLLSAYSSKRADKLYQYAIHKNNLEQLHQDLLDTYNDIANANGGSKPESMQLVSNETANEKLNAKGELLYKGNLTDPGIFLRAKSASKDNKRTFKMIDIKGDELGDEDAPTSGDVVSLTLYASPWVFGNNNGISLYINTIKLLMRDTSEFVSDTIKTDEDNIDVASLDSFEF